jgi:hypothetical protein
LKIGDVIAFEWNIFGDTMGYVLFPDRFSRVMQSNAAQQPPAPPQAQSQSSAEEQIKALQAQLEILRLQEELRKLQEAQN